jgi:hypothetical protein
VNPFALIKKVFAAFKKKSKAEAEADKGAAGAPFEKDDNVVLVFGHSNAGKTVYFSVLYELLKGDSAYKLSPLDNETAANLIENFNLMRGKQLKIKEGRQVEVEGERKFPTMTSETRILKFGLDMSVRKGVKFYTVDYKGETLSIAEPGGLRKQFARFFPHARAALFFIDASAIDTDVLLREQIAAFQTIIADVRDCAPSKIPIGIVITKADFLEGYSPSNPVELIPANAAIFKGRSSQSFIKGLARVNRERFGEKWADSCERVTQNLRNLIDSMISYNLDFQFFFVSATGGLEKTPSGDVLPPRELAPAGVPQPLIWSFNRILFNKSKARWRTVTKWVVGLSIVWIVLVSLTNLFHMYSTYDVLERAENQFRNRFNLDAPQISKEEAERITETYDDYMGRIPVAEFLGAGPLIEHSRTRKSFAVSRVDNALKPPPDFNKEEEAEPQSNEELGYSPEKTKQARESYNRMTGDIGELPPGEQVAAFEAGINKLWTEFPKDSLNPKFVEKLMEALDNFKSGVGATSEVKFSLTFEINGLRERTQVKMQIGSGEVAEFSNFPSKQVTQNQANGVGNQPVKFTWLDYSPASTGQPLTMTFDNPMQDFYPELRNGPVRLGFGKDYEITIRLISGKPPQPSGPPKI